MSKKQPTKQMSAAAQREDCCSLAGRREYLLWLRRLEAFSADLARRLMISIAPSERRQEAVTKNSACFDNVFD
jgi:hypothetical protein